MNNLLGLVFAIYRVSVGSGNDVEIELCAHSMSWNMLKQSPPASRAPLPSPFCSCSRFVALYGQRSVSMVAKVKPLKSSELAPICFTLFGFVFFAFC